MTPYTPKEHKSTSLYVRIHPTLKERYQAACEANYTTMSDVALTLIRTYTEQHERKQSQSKAKAKAK